MQHSASHPTAQKLRQRIAIGIFFFGAIALLIVLEVLYFKHHATPSWDNVDAWLAIRYADVETISTHELDDVIALNQRDPLSTPLLLLDIREASEFAVSHIPSARHVSPSTVTDFAERELVQFDRSQLIVVYCSVGVRSAAAADELQSLGFTHVKNLRGSIFQWANENRSLAGGVRVHPFDVTWVQLLRADLRSELGSSAATR
jgi:rhodanese-related sulfurtransferase